MNSSIKVVFAEL